MDEPSEAVEPASSFVPSVLTAAALMPSLRAGTLDFVEQLDTRRIVSRLNDMPQPKFCPGRAPYTRDSRSPD